MNTHESYSKEAQLTAFSNIDSRAAPHQLLRGKDKMDNTIQRLKAGEVNLGTSIMAVAYEGGVVIGADSRTTTGAYIANRVTDKLTHISDRIYCCRSGSAADTQAVADAVTHHLSLFSVLHGQPDVSTAAQLFSQIVYSNKEQLSAGIIVAGWDKHNGGSVYNVPLGGGVFKQPWAIGGSGSAYIYGYCDSNFRSGWNREQTLEFVKNALSLAMRRDGSSGGTIRMAAIDEEGVERHFVPGDKLPELAEKIC
ncbi:Proteasome subunit beta type-1 [Tilletia horrida]|nr:Proteasome subunit beta type-1 [Tilletia horrida]